MDYATLSYCLESILQTLSVPDCQKKVPTNMEQELLKIEILENYRKRTSGQNLKI